MDFMILTEKVFLVLRETQRRPKSAYPYQGIPKVARKSKKGQLASQSSKNNPIVILNQGVLDPTVLSTAEALPIKDRQREMMYYLEKKKTYL